MTLRALSLSLALLTLAVLPAAADPTGTWRMTADMQARRHFTTTLLDTGEVLVTGGNMGPSSYGTGSCLIYDPLTDHWRQAASMPNGRAGHSAIKLPSGKVLVAGGSRNEAGNAHRPNRTAVLYDPAADRWEVLSEPSSWSVNGFAVTPRMAILADGRVLAMNDHTSEDMRIFDPATKTWLTDYDHPLIKSWRLRTSVAGAQLTSLPDGRVFVAMTSDDTLPPYRGSTSVFDASAAKPMDRGFGSVYPRRLVAGPKGQVVGVDGDDAAVYSRTGWYTNSTRINGLRYSVEQLERLPSGRIVAFNYADHRHTDGRRFEVNLVDLEDASPSWQKIGRRGGAVREGHQYVVLKSGEVLLLGGMDSTYKPLPTYVLTISDEADRIKALQGPSAPAAGSSSGIVGGLTPPAPAQPAAPSQPKIDKARIEGGQLEIEGQGFAGSDVRVYLGRRRLAVSSRDGGTRIVAALPAAAMTTSVRVRVDGRLSASVRLSQPSGAPKLSRAWRAGGVLVIEGSGFGASLAEVQAFFGSRSLRVLWASPTRLLIERPSGRGRLQLEVKGLRSLSKTLR